MSRSLTFCLETKRPWCQTPSRKKKSVVFTNVTANAYQGQLNAGFSKVSEIFKVCSIESLKYIREFHTPVCYCGNISTHPNRDAERNELWLVVWHVGQTASWVGLGQSMPPYIPDLQPSVWRSGYTRLSSSWLIYPLTGRILWARAQCHVVCMCVVCAVSQLNCI